MLTIEKNFSGTLAYSFPKKEELLFFDIETTGFSPKTSAVYLIGVLFYQKGNWHLTQFFADNYTSEKEILIHFFTILKEFRYLVHYNGLGFDIPFLKEKCSQHQLNKESTLLDELIQIDIYKRLFPHKKKIDVNNLKQKTVESFWHIQRKDLYNGGELIKLYQKYIKKHLTEDNEDSNTLLDTLLLHNEEDLTGMLEFSGILSLVDLLEGTLHFVSSSMSIDENQMTITATLPVSFPCTLSYKNSIDNLTIEKNTLTLQINSYAGELKYFYDNYKDYYYLPLEDTAIHKSVASFVDKEYRQKAKRENCYQRKEGIFYPIWHDCSAPLFRKDYKEKQSYFLFDNHFLPDTEWITSYLHGYFQNNPDMLLQSHNS